MQSLTKPQALKDLLVFAGPIILGQLGIMLIGTGDMIIAGRFSREALAAIGLAISIANPIMISLLGLQFALSPILAQRRGAGEDISKYYWPVIIYSTLVSLVSGSLTRLSVEVVPYFEYGENLTILIQEYLVITSYSAFGLCLYQGLKEFYQAQEKTIASNIVALVAVGVNIFLNYALVFGKFGFPQLFEAGLAWASLGIRMFMGLILLLVTYKYWKAPFKLESKFLKEVLKIGFPVMASLFFEVTAFCSVTLFVGKFAEVQIAANNLALNIGSLAFMIPMSIAAAVSVKVGHAYGEKKLDIINLFNTVGLYSSITFTAIMGAIFFIFPHAVMSLYTADTDVIEWGKKLLFWVACFQLFDGAQVTLSGILRGLSVTRAPSIAIFVGYWIIGIPLGYYLGFHAGMEAQGFWIGLALALAVVALMLGKILKNKMKLLAEKGL